MPATNSNRRNKPVFKLAAIDDQEKFKPLPGPVGPHPYHLNLKGILPNLPADKMVFHLCGDTGGLTSPYIKHKVATEMIKQYHENDQPGGCPQFFFHLGDVVYNFGQAAEYPPQFFSHYDDYPGPIFAIAGNHDADVDPFDPGKPESLDAFIAVFCNPESKPVSFAPNGKPKTNKQPNIYWKLITPLADIIGLYSNVPRFGTITKDQQNWFTEELKTAAASRNEKALIVCLHHSAYSADTNHGSSIHMQAFLNEVFETTKVYPDVVFSGHVHNYQRFNKTYPNGKTIPFIVAGAGGYADLHKIAALNDPAFPDDSKLLDGVTLENYCDDKHGFLKITIEKTTDSFTLKGKYYVIPPAYRTALAASLYDSFSINLSGN